MLLELAMWNELRISISCSVLLVLSLLLVACSKTDENAYQPTLSHAHDLHKGKFVVGIHPLHNPQRLMEIYGPLVDYINRKLPEAEIVLEASRNYDEYEKKLYTGHFAFALPNPYETLLSLRHGYRIIAKMADDKDFRGIILVRKDGGIHTVKDLKGKAVSYPAKTALAATMLPQYFLQSQGIDVNRDIENRYVGSQESSIINVYRRHVAAGATWPVPWALFQLEHPEMAAEIEVKWQTENLVNNGWVVRKDVPAEIADKLAMLLVGLHTTEEGKEILKRIPLRRFEPATEATYRPVRDFLEKFSRSVREIEH